MENFYRLLSVFSQFCALLIPVATFFAISLPNIRRGIAKVLKRSLGIEEIGENIKELKQDYSSLGTKLDEHIEDSKSKNITDTCVLRRMLITDFHKYQEQGYATMEDLEVTELMYEQYVNRGGNGVIKHMWEKEILPLLKKDN